MLHFLDPNPEGSPILLLLHGLGATAESWHFQLSELCARGYRLIAPDLPGFGCSPSKGRRWNLDRVVEQVIAMMDRLGAGRFIAAGISMGGAAVLVMAYRHPSRVQGLILINTFSSLAPSSLSEWRYFLRRGWRAFLRKPEDQAWIVAERVFPKPKQAAYRELLVESIRRSDPNIYRQAMLALARFNFTRKLPDIRVPTLVISGAEDTTIPLKNQRELAAKIPGAEHVVIPAAGHAVIADQPVLFNLHVSRFIEKISAAERANPSNG